MSTIRFVSLACAAACLTAAAQGANQLTAAEKKAGWVLLFDGADKFAEWKVGERGSANSNSWIIENGTLKSPDRGDMLFTKKTFSDFEWQLEWKMNREGNSGLFVRVTPEAGWYCSGYEYGILDDANGGDRMERSRNAADRLPDGKGAYVKRTGAIYDLYPTTKDGQVGGQYYDSTASKPFGEWSHGVVWAEGNYVEHWLNGKKVVQAQIGSADWEARYRNSKFYPGCGADYSKRGTGMLGVQDHGGGLIIWLRNVKIRPFTPESKLNSPLITPGGGTFAGAAKVVLDAAITGATVRYTLDGSDPTESSPVFKDSLLITKSATLKARTYRARFVASDVASAAFTLSGSAARSGFAAEPGMALEGGRLRVVNPGAEAFAAEVATLDGRTSRAFTLGPGAHALDLTGFRGVVLVKLRQGEELRVGRFIAL